MTHEDNNAKPLVMLGYLMMTNMEKLNTINLLGNVSLIGFFASSIIRRRQILNCPSQGKIGNSSKS